MRVRANIPMRSVPHRVSGQYQSAALCFALHPRSPFFVHYSVQYDAASQLINLAMVITLSSLLFITFSYLDYTTTSKVLFCRGKQRIDQGLN